MTTRTNKRSAVELLGPLKQMELTTKLEGAAMTSGLSPWERHKLEAQAKRAQAELLGKLMAIELQTVIGEAVALSEGRVAQAFEEGHLGLYEERLRCLVRAGTVRDEAHLSTTQLSEDSRDVVGNAIDRVTVSYINQMDRRAGGGCE